MNQCTALALLPPPAHLTTLSAPGPPPEAGHVLCELGETHDGPHATMLWDEGTPHTHAIWLRWTAGHGRLTPLTWCGTPDPHNADDACGLFTHHPSGHSWEVQDPTHEAITHTLARQHPHLFPK